LCKVLHMFTSEVITDAANDLHGGEQVGRFDNGLLAMHPVRFNGIEPRAFDGQAPGQETDTPVPLDLQIMGPDPCTHLLADVPGGIVPPQQNLVGVASQQVIAGQGCGVRIPLGQSCAISCRGGPSGQRCRAGWASRLHQVSSAKPSTQSACWAARRIRWARGFCLTHSRDRDW
jgi:hypothetical protein